MPAPKLIQTYAFFVREGEGGAARESKPSSWNNYSLGTVTDLNWTNELDEIVFSKPIGGRWVDHDVIAQRDRQTFDLTLSELTPNFWKLLRAANPTLSGGTANYTPGETLVTRGWLQIQQYDNNGQRQDTVEIFCHLAITAQTIGDGLIQARLTGRKLYSTLNSGTFENLTY
jgi:hypothetical protein